VLVTVSDKRIAVDSDNDGLINYYNADVVTANDYYPFGSQMPGRKYSQPNSSYRYGFNGQMKSEEIGAGLTTAMYWEYDSRIGRRWNQDPVLKVWESPYMCFSGNPIYFSDIHGDEPDPPSKTLPTVTVTASVKQKGFWHSKVGSFLKGVGKGIVVGALAVGAVIAAPIILPVIAAEIVVGAIIAVGIVATAKTVAELHTGKANWGAGRKLSSNEKWEMGGSIVGGLIGGGGTSKGFKLFRASRGKAKAKVPSIPEETPTINSNQPQLETPTAETTTPPIETTTPPIAPPQNGNGVTYPSVSVEGYGEVPFPEGPYTPNNSAALRPSFTPSYKLQFKEWWIKQGRPWPSTPVGSFINIHHIKPLSKGGTNAFENLVPLVQPEQHQPFTNWWRSY
jgi:RHS repeat-associated protein